MKSWNMNEVTSLKGKNIIITGANTGLGYETALAVASKGGTVIMACRSQERAEKARSTVLEEYPNAEVDIILLDLGNLTKIKEFVKNYKQKYETLDILINNAGVMTTPYMKTDDGFEFQNGVNHLGHFALTAQLFDLLKSTKDSKLVVVSSIAHKNATIDFDDYMFEKENAYTPMKSYRQSKLSNLLFMKELNRRIENKGYDVKVLAAHPGVSRTELARHVLKGIWAVLLHPLFLLFTQPAKKGALPQLRAALDPNVKTGEYYGPSGMNEMRGKPVLVGNDRNAENLEYAQKLWKRSEELTNTSFNL